MMNDPAADAIARAKEIAARLAGSSTFSSVPAMASAPPSDPAAVAEAALAAAFGGGGVGEKKRRWGGNATESSTAEDAVAAAMSIMDGGQKRSKTDVTKKVWIPSDQNPGYNYIGLLIGPGGSKQRELIGQAGGNVKISIRGRGSTSPNSGENATPGAPEEPLHVLLEGNQESVDRAEVLVNELLHDSAKANAEKDRQLAEVNAGKTPLTAYQPKPVAQLLGLGASSGNFGPPSGVDTIEEKIGVPNGVVGYIIGKGGESITSMQRRSSCRVQIQKEHEMDAGSTQRIITLTAATPESIAQCRAIIEGMVQERLRLNQEQSPGFSSQQRAGPGPPGGGSNAAAQAANLQQALAEGQALVKTQVPNADVGLIIGKGGTTIRSIQDRSGANVQIPQGPDADNPAIRTISVTHPQKEGAEFAKTLIEEVLQSKASFQNNNNNSSYSPAVPSNKPNPGDISMQIQIPDKDVGMCIGRGGCVIREMQGKTSTRIQIPSMPTPGQLYRIATITGPSEGCQKVAEIISRISAEQSSQFVITGAAFQSYGGAGAGYGQQQQQQAHGGQYGQQAQGGQYGQQSYGQQQQYSAYTNTASYGQQQQQGAATTAAAAKSDYSAEWAAYYAAQAASTGATTATAAVTPAAVVAAPAADTNAAAATAASSAQPAADAYHDAFFRYAYHYGDDAARQYYGAWSPPQGTPNPYGTNPNLSAAPATAGSATSAIPAAAPTDLSAVAAINGGASNIKDSSVRNVSNLPAWMTKS